MASLTRKDIRRQIGHDLQGALSGAMRIYPATAFDAFTITSHGLAPIKEGNWLVIDGQFRAIRSYTAAEGMLSFSPDLDPLPASLDDFEVWDQKYYPGQINSLMNQAIGDAEASGVFVPTMVDTMYLPPATRRIPHPVGWEVLREVEATIEGIGYGFSGIYVDLLSSLRESADAEADDDFYPFQTTKVSGQGIFSLNQDLPLGLYDTIGWEVAGDFAGKDGNIEDWEFVRESFNPYTASKNSDGLLQISYNAGSGAYVLAAYLYRESQVEWRPMGFTAWEGSGEIELSAYGTSSLFTTEGMRLRLQGGTSLSTLTGETDIPDVPVSYIRYQALVSLLRSIPDVIVGEDATPIRREWELKARQEMAQLPRMQNVRYLR